MSPGLETGTHLLFPSTPVRGGGLQGSDYGVGEEMAAYFLGERSPT